MRVLPAWTIGDAGFICFRYSPDNFWYDGQMKYLCPPIGAIYLLVGCTIALVVHRVADVRLHRAITGIENGIQTVGIEAIDQIVAVVIKTVETERDGVFSNRRLWRIESRCRSSDDLLNWWSGSRCATG